MTQLTDHAKSILRAIADGKGIEFRGAKGSWHPMGELDALHALFTEDLRIAPETRSINGRVFAAPVDGGDWSITSGVLHALSCISWVDQVDRDKAFAAIIDALEGRTK